MRYGRFSEDKTEYIIERPDTPSPWINYISNMHGYCGIVSQTGGGFSFNGDPRDRRITKYRYNNVPVDRPGRYIYLRDEETGEYWSPTWQPVQKKPDAYECRHGMGYTTIRSLNNGVSSEVLYFVPPDDECEVWRMTLRNETNKVKHISVIPYSEFTMWCEPESRNIQWSLHLTRGSFEDGMVLYQFIEPHPAFDMKANANYVADRPGYAFMGMSVPVIDHDCARDKFIGMYRSESNPQGVENGVLSQSQLRGGVGCAALRGSIALMPNADFDLTVTLGYAKDTGRAKELRDKYTMPDTVGVAFNRVREGWRKYISAFKAVTGDGDIDTMVNVWNQYQCKTTFDWSRYISFYENGEGRGMGTRDSCQDTLAVNAQLPERVKRRIIQILSTTQFETGDTYHQFFPLGGRGDLKGFSDDHLWIPQMVYAYVAETGDAAILKERVKYAGSENEDTVYGHMKAALDYTERMKGPNGLPLILTADWNDTLHLWMECEEPESVLTAEFYVYALNLTAEMAELLGKKNDAENFLGRAREMKELINDKCWDGEWYIRGFGSEVIGTNKSKHAKMFLNSQVWAVISGVAEGERAIKCMDSVRKHLFCDEGVKNVWPAFQEYDQTYGLISRYNTGRKENGIFAHTNAWVVVAEAILGRPRYAYEYYNTILPLKRNERAEVLKTEPYIFCQTVCSDDAQDKGEGANSWLTGTASWMYVAATQYLLGIRPRLKGLSVRPYLPPGSDFMKISRMYRGCEVELEVTRGSEDSVTALDSCRLNDEGFVEIEEGARKAVVKAAVRQR